MPLSRHQIPRKPLPSKPADDSRNTVDDHSRTYSPALPDRQQLSDHLEHILFSTDDTAADSENPSSLNDVAHLPPLSTADWDTSNGDNTPASSPTSEPIKFGAQNVLGEMKYYASGLLGHPAETTKHFSILRHSAGLVYYQGTSTYLTISIFSDDPLPTDRTVWLQSKGWSGKLGMSARALVGRNGYWLEVTPEYEVAVEHIKPDDERAWQRDIRRFYKKNIDHKYIQRQRLRETEVVRIPVLAQDGYYRLVLCTGNKKVLCPSPVFRVLSASASPSSLKGASLSTLPLELGAKALSAAGRHMGSNVIGNFTASLTKQLSQYGPSQTHKVVAQGVYNYSGVESRVNNTITGAESRFTTAREERFMPTPAEVTDEGGDPLPPYPIKFSGYIKNDRHEDNLVQYGLLQINLGNVPEDVKRKLNGFYFGWVRMKPDGSKDKGTEQLWYQAIVSASTLRPDDVKHVNVSLTIKTLITVYIIKDIDEAMVLARGSKLDIQVMGFLRSPMTHATPQINAGTENDDMVIPLLHDAEIAEQYLVSPSWAPAADRHLNIQRGDDHGQDTGLDIIQSSYADTRVKVQRKLDRIPLHLVGLRVGVDRLRESAIEKEGFYIIRPG